MVINWFCGFSWKRFVCFDLFCWLWKPCCVIFQQANLFSLWDLCVCLLLSNPVFPAVWLLVQCMYVPVCMGMHVCVFGGLCVHTQRATVCVQCTSHCSAVVLGLFVRVEVGCVLAVHSTTLQRICTSLQLVHSTRMYYLNELIGVHKMSYQVDPK